MKRLLPVLVLFLLAPAIGELLSSSAPPVEFFKPVTFLILAALYGSGAIIIRELTVRWGKGWLSLLVLGAAYAIIEEGLMVKSFFDPGWVDIGTLGSYGRWAGVNWVWTLELTIYHTFISIATPILLTGLIFPDRKHEPWLGKGGLIFFICLLAADVAFGALILTDYAPGAVTYLITVLVVLALVVLAWRLPVRPFAPRNVTARHLFWFWLTGFLGTALFFAIYMALPQTTIPPAVTMLISLGQVTLIVWLFMRLSGNRSAGDEMQQLALAAGLLSPLILLAPLREFGEGQTDNPAGMTLVALAAIILLLLLRWRIKRREKKRL